MRWLPLFVVLSAGCLSATPEQTGEPLAQSQASTAGPAADLPGANDAPEPGFYELSPDGLVRVDALPGLTWAVEGGVTRYAQDVRELLVHNGDPIILVQALEDQDVTFSYDVDVAYRPQGVVGDPRGSDFICIGTSIQHDRSDDGFYYERAAGRSGVPPGDEPGGGTGHARAGSISSLEEVYGPRFAEWDTTSFSVEALGYVRLSNFLSQYPPDEMRREGNSWFQNYTLPGAHRIIRIPPAPIFCMHGFAEFEGVQLVGEPPFQVARDGRLAIPTLYGATMIVDAGMMGRNPAPTNAADVSYLGTTCSAGGGQAIVRYSFDAGVIEATVQQWSGPVPTMILMGMGVGQEMFIHPGPWGQESCPS